MKEKIIFFLLCCLFEVLPLDFGTNFCPPVWPRYKRNPSDIPAVILLPRDENSGCICREDPGISVVCFGADICKKFPKDVKVLPNTLRIKTTHISVIERLDLAKMQHLEILEIEGNTELYKIEAGVFLKLAKLENLSISYNKNLDYLEPNTFEGLVSLRELNLVQNGFNNIRDLAMALAPDILPSIYKVDLSENVFSEIKENDFSPMEGSSLQQLNLILCQIEYMHPKSLVPLQNLTALRLGENIFNTSTIADLIETSVDFDVPLKLLNLYSVGFRKMPPKNLLEAISKSNISTLCLARNQFEMLDDNSFPKMPNLQILDLREVLAVNVSKNAFKGMPKLRTLLLNGNKLSSVPEGALLNRLTFLDLSDNSGSASYVSLGKGRFVNMTNLNLLNLSFNRINVLFNDTFTGLGNLTVLGLKNSTIFYVAEGSFATMPNLQFLNLENNPFGRRNITKGMFKGLENLQVLLLGGCSIIHLSFESSPFEHLKSLRHLGLERNELHKLYPVDFAPLTQLISLDISENTLVTWQERLFNYNVHLKEVVAYRNKFTYLSEVMLEDFSNLQKMDVSENPFTCACTPFLDLRMWSKRDNETIYTLLGQNPAYCVFPDSSTNITVDQFLRSVENNEINCDVFMQTSLMVVIATPLIILALISMTLAILGYKYRWHVRYWVFLARLQLSRIGKVRSNTTLRSYTNFQYDAFVSYCNEDRNFVVKLVSMLENYRPFLKLCVYERDFQAGSIISETILECVAKSRKTLLIISDSYARSHWCRWETQLAEHHRLFFENEQGEYVDDSLILIKLGPVCESHVTPTLKYLLKTRIYLQWDPDPKKQHIFWERLRSTLAPPKKLVSDETV